MRGCIIEHMTMYCQESDCLSTAHVIPYRYPAITEKNPAASLWVCDEVPAHRGPWGPPRPIRERRGFGG